MISIRRSLALRLGPAVLAAALAAPAPALADGPAEALVLLRPAARATGEPGADTRKARSAAGAVVGRNQLRRSRADVPEIGLLTVWVPAGASFSALARRLRADPDVASVERQRRRRVRFRPNDPALWSIDPTSPSGSPYQWNLLEQNLPAAWDMARGDGVRVGIIDTGIDAGHPDLSSQLAVAVDRDATSIGTGDEIGHGTHVAGLACGQADNGTGIAGAGFGCEIVAEKTDLTASSIVASLVDAANRGVKVINMSYGGRGVTRGENRALRYAVRKDVVLVAAASDEPVVNQGHPAAYLQPMGTGPKLDTGDGLVVTAASADGKRAPFAGRGSQISLAAYGFTSTVGPAGIFSSFPANETLFETGDTRPPRRPCIDCRATLQGDKRFGYLSGTSMAAPQVAGIAALVRSANPRLSYLGTIRVIKETASGDRWNTELGWGIVDAGAAVRKAHEIAADTVAPATRARGARGRRSGRLIQLRWKGSDAAPPGVTPSGVERYRVFMKRRGPYKVISTTRNSSQRFPGKPGARYSFYVQARDRAGNLEAPPGAPDFVVRVRR